MDNNTDREQSQEIFTAQVENVLDEIGALLIEKNKRYGNSALKPVRIFSDAGTIDGIKIRIDDKISRIANLGRYDDDTIDDLIGYLVLLKIGMKG